MDDAITSEVAKPPMLTIISCNAMLISDSAIDADDQISSADMKLAD